MNDEQREIRSAPFKDADVKGRTVRGYAAVYDSAADLGDFVEEVRRGAFRKILSTNPVVPMYYDHVRNGFPPLASTSSGMTLKEDGKGLLVEAEMRDTPYAREVLAAIEQRIVTGMSYGFIAGQGNSHVELRGGKPHRTLLGFKALTDVSPTHDPAYAETTAEVRSMVEKATLLDVPQTDDGGEQPQTVEPVADVEPAAEGEAEPGPDEATRLAEHRARALALQMALPAPLHIP